MEALRETTNGKRRETRARRTLSREVGREERQKRTTESKEICRCPSSGYGYVAFMWTHPPDSRSVMLATWTL